MKKISAKTIKGLLIVSGVATAAIGCALAARNNLFKTEHLYLANDVSELKNANILEEAEKEVEKANAEVEVADQELAKAKEAEEAANNEVANAKEAVKNAEKAKTEAEAQVKAAKTEAERKAAEAKVKAVEAEIKKAKDNKKAAEDKVLVAQENAKKAETAKNDAVVRAQKAEDNKKSIEKQLETQANQVEANVETIEKNVEEIKQPEVKQEEVKQVETKKTEQPKQVETKKTETKSTPTTNEEKKTNSYTLPQSVLDAAARSEAANQKAYEDYLQAQKDAADKAKAEREAQAQKEQEEQEAWNKYIEEQNEAVKNWGSEQQEPVYGDREFTFAAEHANAPFDVTKKENPVTVKCTGGHCGTSESGYIWFARFKNNLNLNIFREPGTNDYRSNVLVGKRGDVASWTQYAPSEINGHTFVKWTTEKTTEQGMEVIVYTAIYK